MLAPLGRQALEVRGSPRLFAVALSARHALDEYSPRGEELGLSWILKGLYGSIVGYMVCSFTEKKVEG